MDNLLALQSSLRVALQMGRDESATGDLGDGQPIDSDPAWSIYRNNIRHSIVSALAQSFPAVKKLVGADFFDAAATRFFRASPPRSAWLDVYGSEFPQFLERDTAAASLPYLMDVARLELLVLRALSADDTGCCDTGSLCDLDDITADRVRFKPHPSFGLLHAVMPVDRIWTAVLSDDEASLRGLKLDDGPAWLVVSRQSGRVAVQRLDPQAWHFAKALSLGTPLALAAEIVSRDVPALLAKHLEAGHFESFSIAPPEYPGLSS